MSRAIKRAGKGAAREKAVKNKRDETDSEDSDALQAELEAEAELIELKRVKKAKRDDGSGCHSTEN